MSDQKCACVARCPYDCWAIRYRMEDPITGDRIDDHQDIEFDGGPCECSCHDPDEDEYDD